MDLKVVFENSLSLDKDLRQQAETNLESMAQQNMPEFIRCLASVVADGAANPAVRQAASIQLKNRISYNKPVRNALLNQEWINCPEEIKSYVRQSLLEGFTAQEELVRAGAANVVAAVATIDFKNEQWGNLGEILSGVLKNPGVPDNTKEAILKCAQYIGENLENESVSAAVGRMLVDLSVTGLSTNSLRCATQGATALASSIPLAPELFESADACTNMVNKIRETWNAISDEDFRQAIFSCTLPLVQYGYETITPHMGFLADISLQSIRARGKSAVPALMFWSNLAECEGMLEDDSKGLVTSALSTLVEPVFQLAIEANDDDDSDEPFESDSLGMIALATISTLSQCTPSNQMLPYLVQFYEANKANPDRRFRDLAHFCLALTFVQAPDDRHITEWICNQVDHLVNAVKTDVSSAVRDTCVYAIRNLFDHKSAIALNRTGFPVLVDVLVTVLSQGNMRVVKQAAPALFMVHETLVNQEKLHLYVENSHAKAICEVLYRKGNDAFREGFPEVGSSCYEALDEWVKDIDQDTHRQFAELLFKALSDTVGAASANMRQEIIEAIQDSHLASLANIVQVLKAETCVMIAPHLITVAMQIFTARTQARKPIPPQGLDLFNFLISRMKEQFAPLVPSIFDAVKFALEDADNHRTCVRAVSCMCLLAMRFPDYVTPRATEIIRVVGQHFENPYVEVRLRGEVIALMSNIAAMEKDDQNLPIVIAALKKTAESVLSPDADEEHLRDADQMYSEVCEAYSRLLLQKMTRLENYLEPSNTVIRRFAERCSHPGQIFPYSSNLGECLRMITDLLIIFKGNYRQLVDGYLQGDIAKIRETLTKHAPHSPHEAEDVAIGRATMINVGFVNAYASVNNSGNQMNQYMSKTS